MKIVANNSITVSNVNDGTITHTAWSYSADGTDRFTTVYPNLNLLEESKKYTKDNPKIVSSSATDGVFFLNNVSVKNLKAGTYTMSGKADAPWTVHATSDANRQGKVGLWLVSRTPGLNVNISLGDTVPKTIEVPKDGDYCVRVNTYSNGTDVVTHSFWDFKLELGSIATPYMPSASEVKLTDYPSYRGEYSDFSSTSSTDPSKYSWGQMRGNISYTAYSWSADGADRFTTVKPNENLWVKSNSVAGYIYTTSGEIGTNVPSHQTMKTLIDVGNNSLIYYTVYNPNKIVNSSNSNRLAFFDVNNVYLGVSANLPQLNGSVTQESKISIPNGVSKVRLGCIAGLANGNFDSSVKVKFEFGNESTIYTTSPQDDYDNAVPRYISLSLKDSNSPTDYTWDPNPERKPWTSYAQGVNGEGFSLMPYGGQLQLGTNQPFTMGYGISNTTWKDGWAYLDTQIGSTALTGEILPQNGMFYNFTPEVGKTYTQSIRIKTDGKYNHTNSAELTWYTSDGHDRQKTSILPLNNNEYIIYSTYTWNKTVKSLRAFDIQDLYTAFGFRDSTATYLAFKEPKLELANTMNIPTPWTPAPSKDPLGVIPKYVGTAALPYDSYDKYEWKINVDWINQFNLNQQSEITNAKNAADKANNSISDMSKDSILTPIEKRKLLVDWTAIQSEYSKLIANANKFGVSTTAYASAYSVLSGYILSLISNLTVNSTIVANTFKTNFKNYYDAKVDLMNNTNLAIQANMDALGTNTAYSYSIDGADRFTTVYPNLNLLKGTKTSKSITGNNTVNQISVLYSFDNDKILAEQGFNINDTITLEFDWIATNPATGSFSFQWENMPWTFGFPKINLSSANSSGHAIYTFNITDTEVAPTATTIGIGCRLDYVPTNTVITFSNVIISKSKTSQPWMPSEKELTSDDIPKYVGYSVRQSENPEDFSWQPYGGLNSYNITKATTAIDQNSKEIALKANKLEVDTLSGRVLATESSLQIQDGKISALNTKTDGHTTQIGTLESSYSGLTSTISEIQTDVGGKAGKTELSQLSQDLSGFKTTVANTYADKVSVASQITQSATAVTSDVQSWTNNKLTAYSTTQQTATSITNAVASKADKTQITQLSDSINLKVSKGDVVSQINVEAGKTLINSKKLVLNANTTEINGNAFIRGDMIVDGSINVEKLEVTSLSAISSNLGSIQNDFTLKDGTTGTLHIGSSEYRIDSQVLKYDYLFKENIFFDPDGLSFDFKGDTASNSGYGNYKKYGSDFYLQNNKKASYTVSGIRMSNEFAGYRITIDDLGNRDNKMCFVSENGQGFDFTGPVSFKGNTSQDTPWVTLSSGVKYKFMFSRVYISVNIVGNGNQYMQFGMLPQNLRPISDQFLIIANWGTGTADDRHMQVRSSDGAVILWAPKSGVTYAGEVSFTL